jgi:3-hydroxyisobutyrate dehydrogenase-like beta-hydroxyacid dehydrogenase
MEITVAGTGRMGSAFVKRAAALGHAVYAWNRTRERLAGLPAKPVSLEETRGVVAVFVADDEAMLEVVDKLRGDAVVLMGTYSVEATADAVRRLAARGIPAVSSPIVGGPGNVERGDAIYLVGGDRRKVEELAPLYSQLGKAVFLGSAEEAAALKLAYNALLIGVVAVLGEAASLAKAYGILDKYRDLLSMTVFKDIGAAYLDRIFSASQGTFALKHAAKDLRYAALAASRRGLPLSAISAVKSLYEVLTALGRGDDYYVRAGALEGGSA